MINERYQQIEKCENIDFDKCLRYFFDKTPKRKRWESKNVKNWFLMPIRNIVLVRPLFS